MGYSERDATPLALWPTLQLVEHFFVNLHILLTKISFLCSNNYINQIVNNLLFPKTSRPRFAFLEGEAFSSWMITKSSSFWRRSSLSCPFRSSKGFVLFSVFLLLSSAAIVALSLSIFACLCSWRCIPWVQGIRKKYIFPGLMKVSVMSNSVPNMLFKNGIESQNI